MTLVHTPDVCIAPHRTDPERARRAVDGAYLCAGHIRNLRDNLMALPRLLDDLDEQQAHGKAGGGQRVSGTPGKRLPINPAFVEHRHTTLAVLVSWVRFVCEERGLEGPTDSRARALVGFLLEHTNWLSCHSGVAPEVVSEVREVTIRARKLLEPPPTRLETGERCRTVVDGERCDGTVALLVDADELWSARCDACGVQDPVPYMRASAKGRMVGVERVRSYVLRVHKQAVSAITVRSWLARGHIQGADGWYELGSVERYMTGRGTERAEKVAG